jgi:hypothetical protein
MMIDLPIVTRRDMLGESCLNCVDGAYRPEFWSVGLQCEYVSCPSCGSAIYRWLSKREVLQLRSEACDKEKISESIRV